ncbi:MAG: PEP/pyruvate-binding domain-containing protein, partial [Planctomycetota bacterium]
MSYAIPFSELTLNDIPRVGGKNASLGELIRELGKAGVPVPGGFALSVDAYWRHLEAANLNERIYA